jgi:hypothetical protein
MSSSRTSASASAASTVSPAISFLVIDPLASDGAQEEEDDTQADMSFDAEASDGDDEVSLDHSGSSSSGDIGSDDEIDEDTSDTDMLDELPKAITQRSFVPFFLISAVLYQL